MALRSQGPVREALARCITAALLPTPVILKVALSADATIGTAAPHGYTIGDGTVASGFQGNDRNLAVNIAHEVDVFLPGDMGVNNMSITGRRPAVHRRAHDTRTEHGHAHAGR